MRYWRGFKDGIPIALGYLSVSFAFGIQAISLGLTPLQAVLISLLNVTSAGQLAGLQLMTAGAGLPEMALTQLTINLRYALMSISLSQKLDKSMNTLHRLLISFANTDEVFAVASSQKGKVGRAYLYGLTNGPVAGWVLGTALGALAHYISDESVTNFQPMNVNYGILEGPGYRVKGKANKNLELAQRALAKLETIKD